MREYRMHQLGLGGFHLAPWMLLAWLAAVDGLVFLMAARAGWSALDLTALVLSAAAWVAGNPGHVWDWPQQLALSGLFTLLGLAPLPRLVAVEGRVRGRDLAVIAVAPLALLLASLTREPQLASLTTMQLLALSTLDGAKRDALQQRELF